MQSKPCRPQGVYCIGIPPPHTPLFYSLRLCTTNRSNTPQHTPCPLYPLYGAQQFLAGKLATSRDVTRKTFREHFIILVFAQQAGVISYFRQIFVKNENKIFVKIRKWTKCVSSNSIATRNGGMEGCGLNPGAHGGMTGGWRVDGREGTRVWKGWTIHWTCTGFRRFIVRFWYLYLQISFTVKSACFYHFSFRFVLKLKVTKSHWFFNEANLLQVQQKMVTNFTFLITIL